MPADMIVTSSDSTVKETIDRIEASLLDEGLTIFARIDHAAAARGVDLEMQDEEVLIFGNPMPGTMLMRENPAMGIELPLKIVAWAGVDGTTSVGYTDPRALASRCEITEAAGVVDNVAGLLAAVTA